MQTSFDSLMKAFSLSIDPECGIAVVNCYWQQLIWMGSSMYNSLRLKCYNCLALIFEEIDFFLIFFFLISKKLSKSVRFDFVTMERISSGWRQLRVPLRILQFRVVMVQQTVGNVGECWISACLQGLNCYFLMCLMAWNKPLAGQWTRNYRKMPAESPIRCLRVSMF